MNSKFIQNSKFKIQNFQKGFTLLEMLLSITLITIIAGISVPVYQSFQTRNDLDIATVEVAQSLRRAQILSQAVDGDTSWGIKIQTGNIILFKGLSYASRDINFDEIFDIPTSIIPSGESEIIFTKFTGLPQMTGTTTLTSVNGEVRNVNVNSKGMINY